jgi:signal recognition particle GTPase
VQARWQVPWQEAQVVGLYSNIAAKKKRIAAGSGEKMRKVGSKGAPTAKAFKQAAKTAKKPKGKK